MTAEHPQRTDDMIARFNDRHDLEQDDQSLMLGAEVGELQEAVLSEDKERIREELGDVAFVVRSIALLANVDLDRQTRKQAASNLEKNAETEGRKVTKDRN